MKNSLHLSFQAQTNLLISNVILSLKKVLWHYFFSYFLLPWCDGEPQNAESFCQMASIELCDQLINLINGELSLQRLIVLPNKSFVF